MSVDKDILYLTIPHEALYHGKLDPCRKMLLSLIAYRDMPGRGCKDSNEELAEVLNVQPRTVQRAIADLKDLGYVYQAAFDGRERILRIVPEYYDLLRGGMDSPRNRGDKLSLQPRQNDRKSDNVSPQKRQIVVAHDKDEVTGKNIKKGMNGNAHKSATEPDPTPEEWDAAVASLREHGVPLKDPNRPGQRAMVLGEVARLREQG